MSGSPWLARLKNERELEMAPTKPTKPRVEETNAGFVGFAGPESVAHPETRAEGGGGFVGFAGADSGAQPNSERLGNYGGIEFREQYAHARAERSAASVESPDADTRARAHLSDSDAATFARRVHLFTERGLSIEAAEALADRLALRDQDLDDRRLCLECSYLSASGRCIAAATGRLPGASARLEPVRTILMRCEAFGLRKGLP